MLLKESISVALLSAEIFGFVVSISKNHCRQVNKALKGYISFQFSQYHKAYKEGNLTMKCIIIIVTKHFLSI